MVFHADASDDSYDLDGPGPANETRSEFEWFVTCPILFSYRVWQVDIFGLRLLWPPSTRELRLFS